MSQRSLSPRTLVPTAVALVALGGGGTVVALAATAEAAPPAGPRVTLTQAPGAGQVDVSSLLTSSYTADRGRLSGTQKPRVKNTQAPVVRGRAVVGRPLTVTPGTWRPGRTTLTYQWYRGDAPIRRADDVRYVPRLGDAGKDLSVVVTGAAQGYRPLSVATTPRTVVGQKLQVVRAPEVVGTARVGRTLRATAGRWSARGVRVGYQWLRGNRAIPGADRKTYRPGRADAGKRLRVKVTAAKRGYRAGTATSGRTAKVAGGRR